MPNANETETGITTIKVKASTRDRLAAHGVYGDSMDDILNRVLDRVKKK